MNGFRFANALFREGITPKQVDTIDFDDKVCYEYRYDIKYNKVIEEYYNKFIWSNKPQFRYGGKWEIDGPHGDIILIWFEPKKVEQSE